MPNSPEKQQELDRRRTKVLALVNEAGLTHALTAEILGLTTIHNDVTTLRKQGHKVSVQKKIDYHKALTFYIKKARSILTQDETERLAEELKLPQIRNELFVLEKFAQQLARPSGSDGTSVGRFLLALYGKRRINFDAWWYVMDDIEEERVHFESANALRDELKKHTALKARAHMTFGGSDELADYLSAWVNEHLTPRQAKVILMRFGLPPYKEGHSLESVGREFRVTQERIRQVQMKALQELCHPSRRWQIDPFALGTNHTNMSDGKALIELRAQQKEAVNALSNHPSIQLVVADSYHDIHTMEEAAMTPTDALTVWLATRSGRFKAVPKSDVEEHDAASPHWAQTVEALCKKIDYLTLPVRVANTLHNRAYTYIVQVVTTSEREFLKGANFGRKSLNELKEVLGELEVMNNLPPGTLALGQRTDHPAIRAARACLELPSIE